MTDDPDAAKGDSVKRKKSFEVQAPSKKQKTQHRLEDDEANTQDAGSDDTEGDEEQSSVQNKNQSRNKIQPQTEEPAVPQRSPTLPQNAGTSSLAQQNPTTLGHSVIQKEIHKQPGKATADAGPGNNHANQHTGDPKGNQSGCKTKINPLLFSAPPTATAAPRSWWLPWRALRRPFTC